MNTDIGNTRCHGCNCPSSTICGRVATHIGKSSGIVYAAFWARREAGATACDQFVSNLPSTFDALPFRGVEA